MRGIDKNQWSETSRIVQILKNKAYDAVQL